MMLGVVQVQRRCKMLVLISTGEDGTKSGGIHLQLFSLVPVAPLLFIQSLMIQQLGWKTDAMSGLCPSYRSWLMDSQNAAQMQNALSLLISLPDLIKTSTIK